MQGPQKQTQASVFSRVKGWFKSEERFFKKRTVASVKASDSSFISKLKTWLSGLRGSNKTNQDPATKEVLKSESSEQGAWYIFKKSELNDNTLWHAINRKKLDTDISPEGPLFKNSDNTNTELTDIILSRGYKSVNHFIETNGFKKNETPVPAKEQLKPQPVKTPPPFWERSVEESTVPQQRRLIRKKNVATQESKLQPFVDAWESAGNNQSWKMEILCNMFEQPDKVSANDLAQFFKDQGIRPDDNLFIFKKGTDKEKPNATAEIFNNTRGMKIEAFCEKHGILSRKPKPEALATQTVETTQVKKEPSKQDQMNSLLTAVSKETHSSIILEKCLLIYSIATTTGNHGLVLPKELIQQAIENIKKAQQAAFFASDIPKARELKDALTLLETL